VRNIEHVQEAFAGNMAFESFHGLCPRLDALVLPFYGVVVMLETMLLACYWYAVNHSYARAVEVFVESAFVVA